MWNYFGEMADQIKNNMFFVRKRKMLFSSSAKQKHLFEKQTIVVPKKQSPFKSQMILLWKVHSLRITNSSKFCETTFIHLVWLQILPIKMVNKCFVLYYNRNGTDKIRLRWIQHVAKSCGNENALLILSLNCCTHSHSLWRVDNLDSWTQCLESFRILNE